MQTESALLAAVERFIFGPSGSAAATLPLYDVHMPPEGLTRRHLVAAFAAAAASARPSQAAASSGKLKVCVFSKHFQWTDWKETARLAAEIGFDGVDLTVRAGGHVLPERVAEDLPKAVGIIRAAGLEAPMITAGIADVESPHAEDILKAASKLGIRYYRWGNFRYRDDESIQSQLDKLRPRVEALARLNKKYGMSAMYHTHSGPGQVGAAIWDIYQLVNGLDPQAVGINLDIGHATVEGGLGDWITSTRLVAQQYLRGTALKDFYWGKNAKGEWAPQWCGLGQGMVNFRRYLGMLKQAGFNGPVQLHFEYPELGGANDGKTSMSISKDQFVAILKRDLGVLRGFQRDAGV